MSTKGRKLVRLWLRPLLLFGPLFLGLSLVIATGHAHWRSCTLTGLPVWQAAGASQLGC